MRIITIILVWGFVVSLNAQLDPKSKSWRDNDYVVTASILNVRQAASKSSEIIDQIKVGTIVLSMESTISPADGYEDLEFYKVRYNAQGVIREGYVSTNYISQFYKFDREELIFLKSESNVNIGYSLSLNLLKNNEIKKLGTFKEHTFRECSMNINYPTRIQGIKRVIEIETLDDDSCSSGYGKYIYTESDTGTFSQIPDFGYVTGEAGDPIIDLRFPEEPYGKDDQLTLVEISHRWVTKGIKIEEVKVKKIYKWNGRDWIEER